MLLFLGALILGLSAWGVINIINEFSKINDEINDQMNDEIRKREEGFYED